MYVHCSVYLRSSGVNPSLVYNRRISYGVSLGSHQSHIYVHVADLLTLSCKDKLTCSYNYTTLAWVFQLYENKAFNVLNLKHWPL